MKNREEVVSRKVLKKKLIVYVMKTKLIHL